MGEDLIFTDKLDETIYYGTNGSDCRKSIEGFFKEMINRKRNIPREGGFQLAGVIRKDSFALKSCNNDGAGGHYLDLVNLSRFLDGYDSFISEKSEKNSSVLRYFSDSIKDSIELRLICSSNDLTFSASNYSDNPSQFQLDTLEYITDVVSKLFDNKVIDCDIYTIGLDLGNFRNVVQEVGWDSSSKERCLNYINSFRDKYDKKSVR